MNHLRHLVVCLLAALTAAMVGCAQWKESPRADQTKLPGVGENPRAVVVHFEFIPLQIENADQDLEAAIWQWVDETTIPIEIRRPLHDNGLRVGQVHNVSRFRDRLGQLAIEQDVVEKFLTQAAIASDVSHTDGRIPMRYGRRHELPLRQPIAGDQVTLLSIGQQTIGRTLRDPQGLLAITPHQGKGVGQVILNVCPEIQYGDTRQTWVSSDSAIRLDASRESWQIKELEFELTGGEGDVFVVAGSSPLMGLAKQFFSGSRVDHQDQQVVLLIQLSRVPSAVDRI